MLQYQLLQCFQQTGNAYLVGNNIIQIGNSHTFLLHSIAVTQCHAVVFQCLVVDGNTVRSTDCILTTVTFSDTVFFIVLTVEVELQVVDDFTCFFRQTVFLTNGITANFTGANAAGNFKTTRLSPFSKVSSV